MSDTPEFAYTDLLPLLDDPYAATDFRLLTPKASEPSRDRVVGPSWRSTRRPSAC